MFGIINISKTELSKLENQQFLKMNAPKHNYTNKSLTPVKQTKHYQCYIDNDTNLWVEEDQLVMFSGKIFNHSEIREKLNLSKDFNGNDGRLLALAFKFWGEEFINKIKGEYALLIIDFSIQSVLMLRDPLGIMPLYYGFDGDTLYFSSELRRHAELQNLNLLDWKYIKLVLSSKVPQTFDQTWFHGIKRLPPGFKLSYKNNQKIQKTRYFNFDTKFSQGKVDFATQMESFRNHLEQAVKNQIRYSDQIVASHLSGGLDSTGIVAIVQSLFSFTEGSKSLITYFCGLRANQSDNNYGVKQENEMIEHLVKSTSLPHPILCSDGGNIKEEDLTQAEHLLNYNYTKNFLLESCLDIQDKGGKMLLSGFGGDEGISYNQLPRFLINCFFKMRWILLSKEIFNFKLKTVLKSYLYSNKPLRKTFRFLTKGPKKIIFSHHHKHSLKKPIADRLINTNNFTLNDEIVSFLTSPHICTRIEREKEFASFYGIEVRYPLLDVELLSYFLSLPTKLKMLEKQGRKYYRVLN